MTQATFVIAEAGVNHNGEVERALQLVSIAASAGADAVKFQTFSADALVEAGTETVAYQKEKTGKSDQHALLKELELAPGDWERIVRACADENIEFMSTAFDAGSLELLRGLGIRRVKVPSGEVTNHPFLRQLAGMGLPVILSTGMADLDEVREAVAVVEAVQQEAMPGVGRDARLVVLQCTSAYPTPPDDANLAAMATMARELGVAVGFSDHTVGTLLAPVAVGMGAVMIEKHFTTDRSLPGPDHAASLEPDELRRMVADIRTVEAALGDGVKRPRPSELQSRSLARRGLKAARPIAAGARLTEADIAIRRPETGLRPWRLAETVGAVAARDIRPGAALQAEDFEPAE